ncbi:MAG: hypothetical protein U0L86_01545 [Alistipes finegoldii]|nr:hypothetical protein [Alistipes finegoldii]
MPENAGEHGKNIREMPEIGSNQIKSAAVLTAADFSYKSGQRHPIRQQPIVSGPTDCSNGRNDKKAADRASSGCRKQECYLKVGVVNQKTLGCAVPALGI